MTSEKPHTERDRIMNALRYCMGDDEASLLLLTFEASFKCENYSDTWPGCPEMTGGGEVDNEEYWDHPWCRTCMARFNIGLPSTVEEQARRV